MIPLGAATCRVLRRSADEDPWDGGAVTLSPVAVDVRVLLTRPAAAMADMAAQAVETVRWRALLPAGTPVGIGDVLDVAGVLWTVEHAEVRDAGLATDHVAVDVRRTARV